MRQKLAIGLFCIAVSGLGGCAVNVPSFMPEPNLGTPPGDLRADRLACNQAHPPRLGNYVPHAECVNAAVERDTIPYARYPDLIRLQERLRVKYSAEIDGQAISARTGEKKMAEADELVEAAIRERDMGRNKVAEHHLDRLQAMLQ